MLEPVGVEKVDFSVCYVYKKLNKSRTPGGEANRTTAVWGKITRWVITFETLDVLILSPKKFTFFEGFEVLEDLFLDLNLETKIKYFF